MPGCSRSDGVAEAALTRAFAAVLREAAALPSRDRGLCNLALGLVAPVGRGGVDRLLAIIDDDGDERLPREARCCLQMLVAPLKLVKLQILENDRRVLALARSTELGRRLMEVPGIGPLVASALLACVPDPAIFLCGRTRARAAYSSCVERVLLIVLQVAAMFARQAS